MQALDLIGQKYGRLTVLDRAASVRGKSFWCCRCACGAESIVSGNNLRTGNTTSCGCHREEVGTANGKANRRHGMTRSPEYSCWKAMIDRCTRVRSKDYPNYGGRGIAVCERWRDFAKFLADMGLRPTLEHTIERRNNARGYEPNNCEWATPTVQGNNKRNNVRIVIDGRSRTLAEWSRESGVPYSILYARLRRGWAPAQAIEASHAV